MKQNRLIPLIFLTVIGVTPALADDDAPAAEATETHEHDESHTDEDHLAIMGDVHLLHAWTRATSDDSALVFVEIENNGDAPVTFTGGASDLAESAALVGFTTVDGEPTYQELPALPIAPRTEMVLAPRALALRLDGLSQDLIEGDSFEVLLTFVQSEVTLNVEVEAANATQHSHAGHSH